MEVCAQCTAPERRPAKVNAIHVIGTWAHIEEPSTIDTGVKPALMLGRELACEDCLCVASSWVCHSQNESGE